MDNPQISTDFPSIRFFILELLQEGEEDLIRRIVVMFRGAYFSCSCFVDVCLISKNKVAFFGKQDAADNRENHLEGFLISVGTKGPTFDFD